MAKTYKVSEAGSFVGVFDMDTAKRQFIARTKQVYGIKTQSRDWIDIGVPMTYSSLRVENKTELSACTSGFGKAAGRFEPVVFIFTWALESIEESE